MKVIKHHKNITLYIIFSFFNLMQSAFIYDDLEIIL